MQVKVEPTPEMFSVPVHGVMVPVRIWRGVTESGVAMDLYVFSVVPDEDCRDQFELEKPGYMKRTRDVCHIDLEEE